MQLWLRLQFGWVLLANSYIFGNIQFDCWTTVNAIQWTYDSLPFKCWINHSHKATWLQSNINGMRCIQYIHAENGFKGKKCRFFLFIWIGYWIGLDILKRLQGYTRRDQEKKHQKNRWYFATKRIFVICLINNWTLMNINVTCASNITIVLNDIGSDCFSLIWKTLPHSLSITFIFHFKASNF